MHSETIQVRVGELAVGALVHLGGNRYRKRTVDREGGTQIHRGLIG